jgi:RNA polymerase sigma-70 factor (ECF subfamily)
MDPTNLGFSTDFQKLIEGSWDGDPAMQDAMIAHSCQRLLKLTRKMFHQYPYLQRWEQTDDIHQNAMIRLRRALSNVRVESVRHFLNLAALQIRRELIDLARHHFGPEGQARHHHTDSILSSGNSTIKLAQQQPDDIASWTEWHTAIDNLDPELREIVNLIFYEGITQEEASEILNIPLRSLKRKWQTAKLELHRKLAGD